MYFSYGDDGMKTKPIIWIVIILSSACTQGVNIDKQKAELMNIDREFSMMSVEKGTFEAFYNYMADDVTIFPKFGHPIKGKETYRDLSSPGEKTEQTSRLEWEPYFADISDSGDLGYTLGRYKLTITDSSEDEQKKYGYYVTIWKKQPNGGWKFVFDTGNESPPPEEALK